MSNFDKVEEIKKLDSNNMIGSLQALGDQLKAAWSESRLVQIPPEYKDVQNIVVAGMGGSALGAHFVRSVFDVSLPIQIVNDYQLPSFVDEKSLLIASSYSGATEETLSSLKDALVKKAKIVGIASGGELVDILEKESRPFYQFDPKYNPCGQPRMGVGYSIGGTLGLLVGLGFINFNDQQMEKALVGLRELQKSFDLPSRTQENRAKKAAQALSGKIPIVIASEFLSGNAHIFANQINESAKTFAIYLLLPEINHHLLEGIRLPENLGQRIRFFFLETGLYSEKIKARVRITKEVLSKWGIESISYNIQSNGKFQAAFEALVFSSWTSFYLAVANEIDPTPIPNVDFFKQQLAKLA